MAKGEERMELDCPHLVLCEGADAFFFLIHLLGVWGKSQSLFEQFRVYDFGGITELRRYLRTMLAMDDFQSTVRSLSVIRDAETDATGACQSVKNALRANELPVPETPCSWTSAGTGRHPDIRTGFVLFPTCDGNPENGTLEDLCLRMLAAANADAVLSHADVALEPYAPQLSRIHKNRLHAYFSLTNDFVSMKVGEAAKAQAFRYDVPQIESLKSFLAEAAVGNP